MNNYKKKLADSLDKNGYVIIKDYIKKTDLEIIKEKLLKHNFDNKLKEGMQFSNGFDAIPNDLVKYFYKKIIVDIIEKLTEKEVQVLSHVDVHLNASQGAWHRDSIFKDFHQSKSFYQDNYNIYKLGIYLENYKLNKPTLRIIPFSHKNNLNRYSIFILKLTNFIFKKLRLFFGSKYTNYFPHIPFSFVKNITVKEGTAVLFDQRIIHAGARKSLLSNGNKLSVFITFGIKNKNTRKHLSVYGNDINVQKDFKKYLKKIYGNERLFYFKNV